MPLPVFVSNPVQLIGDVSLDLTIVLMNFVAASELCALMSFALKGQTSGLLKPVSAQALGIVLLHGALLILIAHSQRLYTRETFPVDRLAIAKVVFWSTLLIAVSIRLGIDHVSLAAVVAASPLNCAAMLGWRTWQEKARGAENARSTRNVLIVGHGQLAHELASYCQQNRAAGRICRGFLVDNEPVAGDVRGPVQDLARIARAEFIDEIIIAAPGQADLARRVIREARRNRLDVKIVPDLLGFEPSSVRWDRVGNVPLLSLHEEPIPVFGLGFKRIFDVAGSTFLLLLSAPLLALTGLLVKLDSVGAVFYCAPRVGKKGRRFLCYKFRTMVRNADTAKSRLLTCNERQGPFFKMANDPRITRLGKWLRRYSLDELPQLWNVLRGDMSLVGPRPHPVDDFARYKLDDLRRLDVTPGLTGLWQVTARQDPSFERNMALDLEYIETWSLGRDLRILGKTASAVLRGSGR